MPIDIDVQVFRRSLDLAAGFAALRSPKPILTKVYLDPGKGEIHATDLRAGIVCGLPVQPGFVADPIVLDPIKMRAILATTKEPKVTLDVQGDSLHVTAGRSKFTLMTEDPAAFPLQPTDANPSITVDASVLDRLLRQTYKCCDPDSTRYALGGVQLSISAAVLRAVATDGRRLAIADAPVDKSAQPNLLDLSKSAVVPLEFIKKLFPVLKAVPDGGQVQIRWDAGSSASVAGTGWYAWTRQVEGRFPAWESVPTSKRMVCVMTAGVLSSVMAQASITTSVETKSVRVEATEAGLAALSKSEVGSSRVESDTSLFERFEPVALSPVYLKEAVDCLDPEQPVEVLVDDPRTAILIQTPDKLYRHILMPMILEESSK